MIRVHSSARALLVFVSLLLAGLSASAAPPMANVVLASAAPAGALPSAALPANAVPAWASRVVKVVVTRQDGAVELGSAVSLAGERMVTNCHVLRAAARIEIIAEGRTRPARAVRRDAYRDLCFIDVPGYRASPLALVEPDATQVGMAVIAVGFSGGEFAVSRGDVVGLHRCECANERVIQTSAAFDRGASGGGLFDSRGRLVGILTFKARAGGDFHFALPVGWLNEIANGTLEAVSEGATFWEQPGKVSAYFLTACDLGAKQRWQPLSLLANEWTGQEPGNPEAWMALGRAYQGMSLRDPALRAFQRVIQLDARHAGAESALQQLEFQLGHSLIKPAVI
jgi:serine protease Do